MTEWKKFTGLHEQIDEMWNTKNGYLVRSPEGANDRIRYAQQRRPDFNEFAQHCGEASHVTEYLICNPHPLADMIKQWADTGQPVYIKCLGAEIHCLDYTSERFTGNHTIYETVTPNWHIPGAEYSFEPFED